MSGVTWRTRPVAPAENRYPLRIYRLAPNSELELGENADREMDPEIV